MDLPFSYSGQAGAMIISSVVPLSSSRASLTNISERWSRPDTDIFIYIHASGDRIVY